MKKNIRYYLAFYLAKLSVVALKIIRKNKSTTNGFKICLKIKKKIATINNIYIKLHKQ